MKSSIDRFSFRSLFPGLLPLFVLAHFAHHLLTAILVPLLPMIRSDFDLDYTRAGFVVSAFSLSYGIAQLLGGWLTDRIGPRLMITIDICGIALAGLLIGLSQTYIMLIALLMVMGILGGGYHPSSPTLISTSVEPKKWGQALGLHMIGGSASFFLSPLAAAAIAVAWSWRGSYISLAVPTLIFGITIYFLLGRQVTAKGAKPETSAYAETLPAPHRLRRLAMLIFLATFSQALLSSTSSFVPLFLVDHFGISSETAAASMSLVFSAGLWASPLGGYLSDRLGRVPLVLTVSFLIGPLIYLNP